MCVTPAGVVRQLQHLLLLLLLLGILQPSPLLLLLQTLVVGPGLLQHWLGVVPRLLQPLPGGRYCRLVCCTCCSNKHLGLLLPTTGLRLKCCNCGWGCCSCQGMLLLSRSMRLECCCCNGIRLLLLLLLLLYCYIMRL